MANVKHRHWIRDIVNFVLGAGDLTPTLDVADCPLGLWLNGDGRARYGPHPAFVAVTQAHEQVHAAAHLLVDLRLGGDSAAAIAGLPELDKLRDVLISSLGALATEAATMQAC
jgi:hypothetical protein